VIARTRILNESAAFGRDDSSSCQSHRRKAVGERLGEAKKGERELAETQQASISPAPRTPQVYPERDAGSIGKALDWRSSANADPLECINGLDNIKAREQTEPFCLMRRGEEPVELAQVGHVEPFLLRIT
jgi:hypothetical protein